MDRSERLLNLLLALIDTTRPLTRDEIQRRVPGYPSDDSSSRRAFERDKETLRSMGVAVMTAPLDADYPEHGDGYRVPPDKYALTDPGLTRDEMDALAVAASAVKLKGDAASAAIAKLGSDHTTDAASIVDIADDERLTAVFAGRSERRTLTFPYKGKQRCLDPYRLSFRSGHWYVNGFDHGYEDQRTYRLDRIEGNIAASDPDAFDIPTPVDQPWLPPWQMGDGQPRTVTIEVDPSQAELAVDQAGRDSVVATDDNGGVRLELTVTNLDGLRSFVLGFLDHAEVVAPQDVRQDFVSYLRELATNR